MGKCSFSVLAWITGKCQTRCFHQQEQTCCFYLCPSPWEKSAQLLHGLLPDVPPFVRPEQVIHADNRQDHSTVCGQKASEQLGYSLTLKSVFLSYSFNQRKFGFEQRSKEQYHRGELGCPSATLGTQAPLHGAAVQCSRCTLPGARYPLT